MARMLRVWVAGIFFALAAPSIAEADAGVPMLALIWPGFWILLLPIVVLEAVVAKRIFGVSWREALWLSGKANVASTFAGIPLTWLVLLLVEMLAAGLLALILRITNQPDLPSWATLLVGPFVAAWIGASDPADGWMIPAAAMWLCLSFFFASVWLEGRVALWRSKLSPPEVRRWSWEANILSYSMIEVMLGALLVWTLIVR